MTLIRLVRSRVWAISGANFYLLAQQTPSGLGLHLANLSHFFANPSRIDLVARRQEPA